MKVRRIQQLSKKINNLKALEENCGSVALQWDAAAAFYKR